MLADFRINLYCGAAKNEYSQLPAFGGSSVFYEFTAVKHAAHRTILHATVES